MWSLKVIGQNLYRDHKENCDGRTDRPTHSTTHERPHFYTPSNDVAWEKKKEKGLECSKLVLVNLPYMLIPWNYSGEICVLGFDLVGLFSGFTSL